MASPELQSLPTVDRADVYKQGVLAATLTRLAEGVEFRYVTDYEGPPVATTLPMGPQAVMYPAGAVPPFFAGLLPEGRRLSALRRAVKTSADDDLSLLLAVGSDMPGDVTVVPEGDQLEEPRPQLEVPDFAQISFAEVFAMSIGEDPDRVGLPGVQEKVSARMISLPVADRDARFILKLNPPEFAHLVENEAFFLRAARESGLSASDANLVTDNQGAVGLLVRRFDRIPGEGGFRPLAFEDACQAMGRYPAQKYGLTSEAVCATLASLTRSRGVAGRELLRQLSFAYLTGNGDAHAKNLAVLQNPRGEWRISPAFDVPSSAIYNDHTMALSINGRRGPDIPLRSFIALGTSLGLPERSTRSAITELCDRADLWLPGLDSLPFDSGQIRKLRKIVDFRRRMLTSG
ncbi:serine/threonine-protein kinase HipA [Allocatelliglobosispora scoriae]|uniref:Serine/threonine-protein kinase HipA n=1 Tax=Allocatelliglobosispora scoriae TaxID=643052 RepID=A0A841BKG3_9ACTN|nr:HipA domain-containing protein [Allocatelliglobosispora scoriae]MBB5869587.1 serine/threonine-protein kinase HipA [Allocatelliglobosispora scoriae]